MIKKIFAFTMTAAMVLLLAGAAISAPSFFGPTGGIFAPNDKVIGQDSFNVSYHYMNMDSNANVISGTVGVTPDLELGIARFDSDLDGSSAKAAISGKYVLLAEKADIPGIAVGVVDASGQLDPNGHCGAYIVAGKNLTPLATNLAGEPVQPLRGYVGVGCGMMRGAFAGLDWAFSPKASVVVEYLNKVAIRDTFTGSNVFNAGLRVKLVDDISAEGALLDGKDAGVGINYAKSF